MVIDCVRGRRDMGCVRGGNHELTPEEMKRCVLQAAIESGLVAPGATADEALAAVIGRIDCVLTSIKGERRSSLAMKTTMTDEAFLNYVLGHSKTPRHAFHIDDVVHLAKLAGVEEVKVDNCGLPNFYGIDEFEGVRPVTLARKRLKQKPNEEGSQTP
jgi:hypothetical protein